MASATFPGGQREDFGPAPLPDVVDFAKDAMERGAEKVEIVAGQESRVKHGPRVTGDPTDEAPERLAFPEGVPEGVGPRDEERVVEPIPRGVACGEIVKVNIAANDDGLPQENQWRPAIVLEAWTPETINAVAFLDGINDRSYGGSVISLTKWVTSATHGFGPGQWCWPDELDNYSAELRAQSPAIGGGFNAQAPEQR